VIVPNCFAIEWVPVPVPVLTCADRSSGVFIPENKNTADSTNVCEIDLVSILLGFEK
jgi:hypothetical protein